MNIPYSELLGNKKYQVIVAGLTGGPVTAIHETELGVAGGNDYTTAQEVLRDVPIGGQILSLKDKAGGVVKLTGRSVLSQFETRLAWSNSLKPNFQINMSFYSEDAFAADTPIDQYLRIKSAVLPTKQGQFFRAPLNYKIATIDVNALTPTGILNIEIGEWFRATQMIMTAESFTFSKEVNSVGDPILIRGSITVEPYAAITYDQFVDYFRG